MNEDKLTPEAEEELSNGKGDDEDEQQPFDKLCTYKFKQQQPTQQTYKQDNNTSHGG